jgi:uncharacterized glyoxalase superfamily protein PhnB
MPGVQKKIKCKGRGKNLFQISSLNPFFYIIQKSNDSELYFEEEDLDYFLQKLNAVDSIEYVHDLKEQPWGQCVIRFYDPYMHYRRSWGTHEKCGKKALE